MSFSRHTIVALTPKISGWRHVHFVIIVIIIIMISVIASATQFYVVEQG